MKEIDGLIDELRSYKRSHALATAVGLGLLDVFRVGNNSVIDVANKCGISPDFVRPLLGVLLDSGLLSMEMGGYVLTALGRDALDHASFRAFADYHRITFEAWAGLEDVIRSGSHGGKFHRMKMHDLSFCEAYLLSMEAIAQNSLAEVKRRCSSILTGNVLDIGAGPSTVCRSLAEAGKCKVTALDRPEIAETASRLFRYPGNFQWAPIDFEAFIIEKAFNAIYCSHVLEYCGRSRLHEWLKKIRSLLVPGGHAAFLLFLRTTGFEHSIELDLFELSTGVNGDCIGRVPMWEEIETALEVSGATGIELHLLPSGSTYPEHLVICNWSTSL